MATKATKTAADTTSSATHAGGGVCGIPGMQAARAAIADRRAAHRRLRGRRS